MKKRIGFSIALCLFSALAFAQQSQNSGFVKNRTALQPQYNFCHQ